MAKIGNLWVGNVDLDVRPIWWRNAEPREHWIKAHESIWSWDHPLRKQITSVTMGFQALSIKVALLEGKLTIEQIAEGQTELIRRLQSLEPELTERELARQSE